MDPPTRVVVTYWGNWPQLDLHLRSHSLYTPDEVEIVVVDQTHGDGVVKGVTVVHDETDPANYSTAHNLGADGHEGILVFLNNDTVVTPGWHGQMLETKATIERGAHALGLVGMRSTMVSGPQALAGGEAAAVFLHRRIVTCAAWCLSDAFSAVGGFDPDFPYLYSDDALSARFCKHGYTNFIGPPAVYHFGHVDARAHGLDPSDDPEARRGYHLRYGQVLA